MDLSALHRVREEAENGSVSGDAAKDAILAVMFGTADDVALFQAALAAADAADSAGDTNVARALRDGVKAKADLDYRTLAKGDDGEYIWPVKSSDSREESAVAVRALAAEAGEYIKAHERERITWAYDDDRTVAELSAVLMNEFSAEFYRAVLLRDDCTPEMVDYCSYHPSISVIHSVAVHPAAGEATLRRIEGMALHEADEAETAGQSAEGDTFLSLEQKEAAARALVYAARMNRMRRFGIA
jgi:hypothetical protein